MESVVEVEDEIKIELPEIVYKSCQKKWIVSLAMLDDTITNLSRDNVADSQYAKFRGNKFRVVKIENKYDPTQTIESITNSCYGKELVYETNKIVMVEDYDMNMNKVCSTGIHFFLTRDAAHGYEGLYNEQGRLQGLCRTYYDNGMKRSATNYENGIVHGLYTCYRDDSTKSSDIYYEHGRLHGSYTTYYRNGNRAIVTTYKHNMQHGLYTDYYPNGSIFKKINYEHDKITMTANTNDKLQIDLQLINTIHPSTSSPKVELVIKA